MEHPVTEQVEAASSEDEFPVEAIAGGPEPAPAAARTAAMRTVDLVLAFVVTFLPPVGFVLGIALWYEGVLVPGAAALITMVALHAVAILGVELGYHRLFTHRSYRARRGLKIALACLGSVAFQGPVIWWSSIHRKHHKYSDIAGDPHSMWADGTGRFRWRNAIHAHVGWLWSSHSVGRGGHAEYVTDLYRDRDVFWIHMHYVYFLIAGFALPAIIVGAITGTWQGAAAGLLWAGFVRIFFANHLTYWCINSVLHSVGTRPYDTKERSTNLAVLSLVTWGQGWHNNHHACPPAAVMGHRWWQLDPGAWVLHGFRRLGWIDRMILPSDKIIAAHTVRPRAAKPPTRAV